MGYKYWVSIVRTSDLVIEHQADYAPLTFQLNASSVEPMNET